MTKITNLKAMKKVKLHALIKRPLNLYKKTKNL